MIPYDKIRTIVALSLAVFIPFGAMIVFRINQTDAFTRKELLLYPLIFGGAGIVLIWFLKTRFLKESLKDFNRSTASAAKDLRWGFVLSAAYFILFYLERYLLSDVLVSNPNYEMLDLMLGMREHPIELLIWFGPVLWIGIALFEEIVRVFLLSSLWKFSDNTGWVLISILFSGLVFGLAHWSQGSYGMVTIGIKSLLAGWFFFKIRRLMPLIYAHVLYDGLQLAILLIIYPGS